MHIVCGFSGTFGFPPNSQGPFRTLCTRLVAALRDQKPLIGCKHCMKS